MVCPEIEVSSTAEGNMGPEGNTCDDGKASRDRGGGVAGRGTVEEVGPVTWEIRISPQERTGLETRSQISK